MKKARPINKFLRNYRVPSSNRVPAITRISPIQLFAFPTSPYAMKVGCYLAFLKLEYQFVGVSPVTFQQIKFTGRRQVPVLKIADEWKLDSQEIGFWLEDTFPGSKLLGDCATDRAEIIRLDNWVSENLIPAMFRVVVDWPTISTGFSNGWKLAHVVNQVTPIPRWVQLLWPLLLRKAKFIVALMDNIDRSKSLQQSQDKIICDFIELLDNGPFLGGRNSPSLADLSAFAIIVFPYRFDLRGDANWVDNHLVIAWITAMQRHLPDNPFLVDSRYLPRAIPGPG